MLFVTYIRMTLAIEINPSSDDCRLLRDTQSNKTRFKTVMSWGPSSELRLPGQEQARNESLQSTANNDSPPRLSSPSIYFSIQEGQNRQFNNELNASMSSVREVVDMDSMEDLSRDYISTSAILNYCKQKVLKPYFRLLSILGWRPLVNQATLFENQFWVRIINCIYTALIISLILMGYFLQYSCCYRQDGYKPYASDTRVDPVVIPTTSSPPTTLIFGFHGKDQRDKNQEGNQTEKVNSKYRSVLSLLDEILQNDLYYSTSWPERTSVTPDAENRTRHSSISVEGRSRNGTSRYNRPKPPVVVDSSMKCRGNFFALYLIPNVLHFLAYLFILHLMRTPDCERLENLMERGFLQTTRTTGWAMAHKKLINSLRSFLWICLVWLILSFTIHGLMVGSRVYHGTLDFRWIQPPKTFFVFFVALTIVSMTFNDFICGSIATSYAVHCQLNISYIINLCASIREKRVDFQEFYKRIEESRKFIDYLNHDQALGISLLQITVGCKLSVGIYALLASSEFNSWTSITIVVVLLSLLFWASIFTVPLIQAIRLTAACQELKKIGHELRARPFGYQDAQQDDLDSLLLYTTNLSMEAKILYIPIKSSCILIICVLFIIAILMLGQLGLLNF